MTSQTLSDDLDYVRQLAEEGASAPILSGRFSILWGSLVAMAMIAHWSVMTGMMALNPQWVWTIWAGMGVLGFIGSAILSATMSDKPGQSTPGNRADQAVWPVTAVGLFLYASAIGVAVFVRDLPAILFDTIIPVAFLTHALNKATAASLFREGGRKPLVLLALLLVAVSMLLIGRPELYLIAAIGVILLHVVPGYFELRAEPSKVV